MPLNVVEVSSQNPEYRRNYTHVRPKRDHTGRAITSVSHIDKDLIMQYERNGKF